jgi:Ser/Thr protein kinase RdoA (MazF antagonist)
MTDSRQVQRLVSGRYGMNVACIVQMKTVCGIVDTDGRRWIWKPAGRRDSEARLYGLRMMADQLAVSGLRLAAPVPTRDGRLLAVDADGSAGYLQPWVRGRHANLRDAKERESALTTVALMHRLSRPMLPRLGPLLGAGRFAERLRGKRRTLSQVWYEAESHYPPLKAVRDQVFAMADTATAALSPAGSAHLNVHLCFCHRDLAPHNLLWQGWATDADRESPAARSGMVTSTPAPVSEPNTKVPPMALIDFDHAGIDDPLLDLMQLCNHTVYFTPVRQGHFQRWLGLYCRVAGLDEGRERQAWQVLLFPDVLVRVLAEWVGAGCPKSHLLRVQAALMKEGRRLRAWSQDYAERFGESAIVALPRP